MKRTLAFAAPLGLLAIVGACTSNSAVGQGGACFQSIDCQEGLACIPNPNDAGGGTCSGDLSSIQKGVDAGGGDVTVTDATTDGSVPEASPDTGVPDNNVPDNTSPPDTGAQDTGSADGPLE